MLPFVAHSAATAWLHLNVIRQSNDNYQREFTVVDMMNPYYY